MRPLLDVRGLCLDTLNGRPLLRDLTMSLDRDRVAIVGRNGVGKSSLLQVLAGHRPPMRGSVDRWGAVELVPQHLGDALHGLSHGQRRRQLLERAFGARPDLVLLDEPSEDLDEAGRAWLFAQVRAWDRGLIVVSHDPELLAAFEHFFVMAESGCHHVAGTLDVLQARLAAEDARRQERYSRHLNVLVEHEAHHQRVAQRRRRKKAVGRLHEIDRCQSRIRLNERRSSAQVSQARVSEQALSRQASKRAWARATRRALAVSLPLALSIPALPAPDGDVIALDDVSVVLGGRTLVDGVTLGIGRERLGVTGPNGSGKTTLLRVILQDLRPTVGRARSRLERIGSIAQGAVDWATSESLLERLARTGDTSDADTLAVRLVGHRFPLELALRPLASLSPGERTRAALICLFQQPGLEVLVLDEPTFSLDLVGVAALTDALRAWPGGLVVASHDPTFLEAIGTDRRMALR